MRITSDSILSDAHVMSLPIFSNLSNFVFEYGGVDEWLIFAFHVLNADWLHFSKHEVWDY